MFRARSARWLLLLRELRNLAPRGRPRVRDRVRGERLSARHGGVRATIDRTAELLATWPGSRDLYLPAPEVGALFRNPALAATYRRIVDESRGGTREEEIERARVAFYEGFVAEEIDRFCGRRGGTARRATTWPRGSRRSSRPPRSTTAGSRSARPAPGATGPVALQQLALLEGFDLAELSEAELVHVVTECAKLAFADRDALYGDAETSGSTSCSRTEYSDERRALVAEEASEEYRPGFGRLPRIHDALATVGSGEPSRGTVHLDVADRFGNVLSATPSGGWLQSSPVIPALGWPLGTRAQMFWLEEGLAVVAQAGRTAADDALPGARTPRRQAVPRLGNAWRRPAGAVGAPRLPPSRRPRARISRRRSTLRSSTPTT